MTTITVTTQAELDAALATHGSNRDAEIIISSPEGVWLNVTATVLANITATGWTSVRVTDSAHVYAYDSARVTAYDSASVTTTTTTTPH